MKIFRRFTKS